MKQYHIDIEGMSCQHCVMAVRKELSKIDGVTVNEVRIGSSDVAAEESKVTQQQLRDAVAEAGYSVIAVR